MRRLSQGKADTVKKLLKEGLSHRAIQEKTGVARATISNVRSGRWDAGERQLRKIKEGNEYKYPSLDSGPSGRCYECGATVYLPCHACWVRRQIVLEAKRRRKS